MGSELWEEELLVGLADVGDIYCVKIEGSSTHWCGCVAYGNLAAYIIIALCMISNSELFSLLLCSFPHTNSESYNYAVS